MAREGLEPSKPLGRQIYSLLRLTAPQPRQLSVLESSTFDAYLVRTGRLIAHQELPDPETSPTPLESPVELAEGFEPPTG